MNTKTKKTVISSLAAPTDDDIAIWNAMSEDERRAVLRARADEAAASKTSTMSVMEVVKAAKSELKNG